MSEQQRVVFTKEMKETHTILIPMMLPIHFKMFKILLNLEGYNVEVLETNSPNIVNLGLKYVHNDTCYPAQLTIGQLLDAVINQGYDTDKVALLLMQTGGGCRASNYISLLRKALKKAHLEHIPVLSFNLVGLEENPGFKFDKKFIIKLAYAILYGDLLMNLVNQIQPYEVKENSTEDVLNKSCDFLKQQFINNQAFSKKYLLRHTRQILKWFSEINIEKTNKPRVGIVGEIYVKFAPLGNNNLQDFLAKEDCEVVIPGLMDFVLYTIDTGIEDYFLYGTGKLKALISKWFCNKIIGLQNIIIEEYRFYPQFHAATPFQITKEKSQKVIHIGTKMGEGWLLTGEMVELLESGVNNIICTQPFGCLPNHIVGRGMLRKIKELYPSANIVPIDYDASATKVNQENRIKLMLASSLERQY